MPSHRAAFDLALKTLLDVAFKIGLKKVESDSRADGKGIAAYRDFE